MSSEWAVEVQGLSKCYAIYAQPRDRLKQAVLPRIQQMLGRTPMQYYREFWALRDITFSIRKGETVGIIGRNGSGKSTLLQMICGVLNPTSGSIKTQGRIASLLELGAGFNGEFTGRENVYLSATLHGLTRTQIDERFDRLAEFADIGSFIDQPVKTYSSGMFVRLAFAVIAHVDADLLVIDEALAVGDAFFVQKCMRYLREFSQRGTLIFVSHDVGAVLSLCESAVWLHEGRLRALGSPKALTNEYMKALYEDRQGMLVDHDSSSDLNEQGQGNPLSPTVESHPTETQGSAQSALLAAPGNWSRDMRHELINSSTLRNDIEVFAFDPEALGFGSGGATIVKVDFQGQDGRPFSWLVGGEVVRLVVEVKCKSEIHGPIVGFIVKDRLGQVLFGDNTYLVTSDSPMTVSAGRTITAIFDFTIPRLPTGDYSVSVAVAEGTQAEHIQHHWMHDALTFKVATSSVYAGLVGIPMAHIELILNDRQSGAE